MWILVFKQQRHTVETKHHLHRAEHRRTSSFASEREKSLYSHVCETSLVRKIQVVLSVILNLQCELAFGVCVCVCVSVLACRTKVK